MDILDKKHTTVLKQSGYNIPTEKCHKTSSCRACLKPKICTDEKIHLIIFKPNCSKIQYPENLYRNDK